jgi:hypothetical protein
MIYQVYISTSAVMIQEVGRIFDLIFLLLKRHFHVPYLQEKLSKTIKGGDVPRDEQPALTTVSTGVCQLPKKCL